MPSVSRQFILSADTQASAPAWTGWSLLYKRLAEGRFQWPRSPEEVRGLTQQQFRWLMEGLTTAPKKSVKPVEPPEYAG